MPAAPTVKKRCEQVLNWLKSERPCGREVSIRWVRWTSKARKNDFGETVRSGNALIIKLDEPKCRLWVVALETLIHEYTHCRLWGMAKVEHCDKIDDHDGTYWSEYGTIYNMFHYKDGWKHSKEFPF